VTRPLFNLDDVQPPENAVHRQWKDLAAEVTNSSAEQGLLGLPEEGATAAERCLVPLLREMRWQGNDRLLFEALPHFDRIETFQNLRTVLNRLNIKTALFRGSPGELTSAQLPCLRLAGDDVQVIAARSASGELRAFSGRAGEAVTLNPSDIGKNELYLAYEENGDNTETQNNRSWFSTVTKRFRTSVLSILLLGFVLNILALGPPLFIMAIYDKAIGAKSSTVLLTMAVGIAILLLCEVAAVGEQKSKLNSFMIETFRNQRALRNLAVDDIWLERFSAFSTQFNRLNIHARHITHVLQTVSQTLMTICGVLVLGIGAMRVMNGDMSLGALIATMALCWRVLNPMNQAFLSITQLAQSRTVIDQINNLMQVQLEREPGHLPKITRDIRGDLKISSLVLRYPGATEASLKGLELTIRQGETVAITGPSGSGKTALFQAIIGLFQPQVGSILFDGLDVRQLDAAEWRSSIGYAPDDLDFFYGTVKQNLLLSEPGAHDERLKEVTGQLGLLAYLEENFNGLETRLNGEVLKQIPDNMKQRIVLARALVKSVPLYLFDNPGTHLDFEGDKKFMEMIEALKGKSTILINTQRPSHMKMADRVVVLRGGAIAMVGTPEQVVPVLMGQTAKAG
jgi:ABC-type bacteriocin/lantibiotic exporter with double-glycine peptidase domain